MTILTPERLAEIEARAKKATPGPMQILHEPGDLNECYWIGPKPFHSICEVRNGADDREYGGKKREKANAEFVLHAFTDIPALLASHAALQAEVERLREDSASWRRVAERREQEKLSARTEAALEALRTTQKGPAR